MLSNFVQLIDRHFLDDSNEMEGGRFGTFRKSAVRVDTIIVSHKIDGKKYEYKKIFSIGLTLLRLNYIS